MFSILRKSSVLRYGFRSAVFSSPNYSNCMKSVSKQLHDKIKVTGPISIAEFMTQTLTFPEKVCLDWWFCFN